MVLHCSSCGHLQPTDLTKFCCECGARLGAAAQPSQTQGAEKQLIQPLTSAATSRVYCASHKAGKVAGCCPDCSEFVCFDCLTEKPGKHDNCADITSLEDLLGAKDPFKERKSLLHNTEQTHATLLQQLKTRLATAQKRCGDEVTSLRDMEKKAVTTLQQKYETGVSQLAEARDKQMKIIRETTKQKVKDFERSSKKISDGLTVSIDSLTHHLRKLATVKQKLSKPVKADNLRDQVDASKEAGLLVKKNVAEPPPPLSSVATRAHREQLLRVAELKVTVTVQALEASAQKAGPPTVPTVPLWGPKVQKQILNLGARVVRGPHWGSCRGDEDGHGPGTVTWVVMFCVSVRWDNTGEEGSSYSVGPRGEYEIQLAGPPP